jgi:hypothetical protein
MLIYGANITKITQPRTNAADANERRVAAAVVGAIDQQAAHAHVAHLGEGDFLGAVCHQERLGRRVER